MSRRSGKSSMQPLYRYYCPACMASRYCPHCYWRSKAAAPLFDYRGGDYGKEPGDYARRRRRREKRRKIQEEIRAEQEKYEKIAKLLDEAEGKEDTSEPEHENSSDSEEAQKIFEVDNLHIHIKSKPK